MHKIYKITNLVNGKFYIGKTSVSIEERWSGHIRGRNSRDTYFNRAIRKYGRENFQLTELDCTESEQQANWLESFYIGILDARNKNVGYNMTVGGDGGDTRQGIPHSEETKEKIRAAHIGRITSDEWRKNMSLGRIGLKDSDETKRRKSLARLGSKNPMYGTSRKGSENPMYGKRHSDETRKKIADALFIKTVAWG